MDRSKQKIGLIGAVCMVVGTVIGSGIFFKAESVHLSIGGNPLLGVSVWLVSGVMMIALASQFAVMATHYGGGSLVDYAEATLGAQYACSVARFLANIYYPGLSAVLSWVSARYFGALLGWGMAETDTMVLAFFLLLSSYALNLLSPRLAGQIQIGTTGVKLASIALVAAVGLFSFGAAIDPGRREAASGEGFFSAIVSSAFAYDGWIVATSITGDLKRPKRDLPLALTVGPLIVMGAYLLYYIGGVVGGFGMGHPIGSSLLRLCIFVSCFGTLLGLMLVTTRGLYEITSRGLPTAAHTARERAAGASAVWGIFVSGVWLCYFYGASIAPGARLGALGFDISELPIVTLYAFYIPILVAWMKKGRGLSCFRRFILPFLAIVGAAFMVFAAVYAHGIAPCLAAAKEGRFSLPLLPYLAVFTLVLWIGHARGKGRS